MIEDIFKTPIYFEKLILDNKTIANYCLSLQSKDKGRVLSNQGGWQSDNLTDIHKQLNPLFTEIQKHITKFNKTLDLNGKNKLGNLWVNINGYRDSNRVHNHPGSIISGVYYIQTPKNCGDITFINPVEDHLGYIDKSETIDTTKNYNPYNSTEWWLPSLVGRLYLFPSWLKHYVTSNLNKKEKRISISFNTF